MPSRPQGDAGERLTGPGAPPRRVSYTRAGWAALAVVAVLLVGLIATLVGLIEDQRRTSRTQRAVAERQLHLLAPLIKTAQPALDAADAQLPRTAATLRRVDRLTRELTPLAQALRTQEAPTAIRDAGNLSRGLLSADAPAAIQDAGRLSRGLLSADAPRLLQRLGATATEVSDTLAVLSGDSRLRRTLVGTLRLLRETRTHDLVSRLAAAAVLAPRVDAKLGRSLAVQTQTLQILKTSLGVQLELMRRVQNLDRKFGGSAPAPAPAPTTPVLPAP